MDSVKFPFNLCCSILFPEFKLSMRTGNIEDDDKYLAACSEDEFVEKGEASPEMKPHYLSIFDEKLMDQEYEEEQDAYKQRDGESKKDFKARWSAFYQKRYPWQWQSCKLSVNCSDSLAIVPADKSCFTDPIKEKVERENFQMEDTKIDNLAQEHDVKQVQGGDQV